MISALLLAAGSARRFGAPKLLEQLGDRPVIRWAADVLLASDIDRLAVVVPPDHRALAKALDGLGVSLVVNPDPERGIGASIAAGVSALEDDAGAVLVALADEPALDPAVVAAVIETYRGSRSRAPHAIVAPIYRGVPGHPVLFDRSVFPELRALTGDRGARSVVERDASRVAVVEIDAPPAGDVDTPEDLARMRLAPQNTSRHSPSPRRDS